METRRVRLADQAALHRGSPDDLQALAGVQRATDTGPLDGIVTPDPIPQKDLRAAVAVDVRRAHQDFAD